MINRQTLEQLREFDTALLANLLGYVDPTPPEQWYMGSDIRSLTPTLGPTVGVAVTCQMDTSTPQDQAEPGDAEGFWTQVAAMAALKLPTVWVVQAVGSRPEHECVLGDGMGKALYAAGCVGAVTSGGVRDIAGLLTTPLAVYASGVTIHHCKLRVRRIDVPVQVGGITVHPGEVIHANAEGVIKLPAAAIAKLLAGAPAYRAYEHESHQTLRRTDLTVSEKRKLLAAALARCGFSPCVS